MRLGEGEPRGRPHPRGPDRSMMTLLRWPFNGLGRTGLGGRDAPVCASPALWLFPLAPSESGWGCPPMAARHPVPWSWGSRRIQTVSPRPGQSSSASGLQRVGPAAGRIRGDIRPGPADNRPSKVRSPGSRLSRGFVSDTSRLDGRGGGILLGSHTAWAPIEARSATAKPTC